MMKKVEKEEQTENPEIGILCVLQNSLFLPSRDNIEKQDGAEGSVPLFTQLFQVLSKSHSPDPVRGAESLPCASHSPLASRL